MGPGSGASRALNRLVGLQLAHVQVVRPRGTLQGARDSRLHGALQGPISRVQCRTGVGGKI